MLPVKRRRDEDTWVKVDDWKSVVKPRLSNPRDGDRWVKWNVPENVADLLEGKKMEMEELILNGGPQEGDTRPLRTGYIKCALSGCPCFGKTWRTSLNKTRTDRRAVRDICAKHRDDDQRFIDEIFAPLPYSAEVRRALIELCVKKGIPFVTFQSAEFYSLLQVALKKVPKNQRTEIISELCCSARTLIRFADERSGINLTKLRDAMPGLVENGSVEVYADHKFVGADRKSRTKILGVDISIADFKLTRRDFLAGYLPAYSTSSKESAPKLTKILEDLGILDAVKKGRVRIITDSQAIKLARDVGCPLPSICASHSFSNALKRAIEILCAASTKLKWTIIKDFAHHAEQVFTLNQLPFPEAANSLNNYARNKNVEEDHGLRYQRSVIASTWHDINVKESEIDDLVDPARVQYGKALEKNVKDSTRFRKYCATTRTILLNQRIYEELFDDPQHPHAFLTEGVQKPDFNFIEEIMPVIDRLERSINLFESTKYQNGSSNYAELERNLIFIAKYTMGRRSREADDFCRSLLTALTEQITQAHVDRDGNTSYPSQTEGRVPCRILLKDKIAAVLDYSRTYCDFGIARSYLGNTELHNDPQLIAIEKVLADTSANWRKEAFSYIEKLAIDWDLDPYPANMREVDPNQNRLKNLQIDPRMKNNAGLQRQSAISLASEIENYTSMNGDDIKRHELYCEEKFILPHLRVLEFWKNSRQTLPRLSVIGINFMSSGNSSSSMERLLGWSSLQTSPHRRCLAPHTLQKLYQASASAENAIDSAIQNKK